MIISSFGKETQIAAFPLEEYGNFIMITPGWEKLPNFEGSTDIIRAYDLKTGKQLWENYSNAMRYNISPNKRYLIPENQAFERRLTLDIIDLKNGNKLDIGQQFPEYSNAIWLDNERIALLFQQMQMKSEDSNPQETEIRQSIKQIQSEMYIIRYKKKKGYINNNDDALKQLNTLEIEENQLKQKLKDLYLKNRSTVKHTLSSGKLVIYNIKNKLVEVDKLLFTDKDEEFIVPRGDGYRSIIYADKNKNLYCIGYIGRVVHENYYMIKISYKGDYVWKSKIEEYSILTKVIVGDDIYIKKQVNPNKNIFFIDTNNGQSIPYDEFKYLKNSFNNSNIDIKSVKGNVFNINNDIRISKKNNMISILNKRN